jgi:hypothetical protein
MIHLTLLIISLVVVFAIDTTQKRRNYLNQSKSL